MRHSRKTGLQLSVVLLAVGVLTPGLAPAQVLDESYSGIQLYTLTPGARATAMGGAFLGLADDPTAAYINPAGLTGLEGSNIEVEIRDVEYHHVFPDLGHFGGVATQRGFDTQDGILLGDRSNQVRAMPFLGYVYAGEGWAAGAYRHQMAQFEAVFATKGIYAGTYDPDPAVSDIERLFPSSTNYSLDIANYGLSFAFDFGESVSVGIGASYYEFELDVLSSRYYFFNDPTLAPGVGYPGAAGTFWGEPIFGPGNIWSNQVQHGEDDAFGFNIGVLWRISDMVWLGAAFRQGPEFDFAYSRTCIPREDPKEVDPVCYDFASEGTFKTPSVYGIGVAVMPTDRWTITFDWDFVEYSRLVSDVTGDPGQADSFDEMRIKNANEVHLGAQYRILSIRNPVSIRFGFWLDPRHQADFTGGDRTLQAMFSAGPETEDEVHATAGVGWEIDRKIRVDLAFDISDRVDMLTLSAGYRF